MVESLTFISVLSLCVIFIVLYFHFIRNFKFWQNLGIPYATPTPLFGNLKDRAFQQVNISKYLQHIYEEHSDKPYVGIFSFDKPTLLIRDLELVKNILVKDFQYFIDRIVSLNEELDTLRIRCLLMIKGQRWYHLRTNLTPAFTSCKIKNMFYLVVTCDKELVDCLIKATAGGFPVDVAETMFRYTTDVIASCTFGINVHLLKDPDKELRRYMRNLFDFSVRKGLAILTAFSAPSPPLTTIFKLKCVGDYTNNYVRKTVWSTELDAHEFVGQAFQFLVAGFETSESTMSYALYELALLPEIQNRLRAEIVQVLNKHNGQLTYDGIREIGYMNMAVSGMRFGLMQVKTALYHMLHHFKVAPCKETPMPIVFDTKSFLLTSKAQLPLFLKQAQQ